MPERVANEHLETREVYCGMRLLCVGRHEYLSEHLCRLFGTLDVQCRSATGVSAAPLAAAHFEPHLVVADGDLLNQSVLDAWSRDDALQEVPVLAVSLTRRPDEYTSAELSGIAGVIYLPSLKSGDALALLHGACRPRGVDVPTGAHAAAPHLAPVIH